MEKAFVYQEGGRELPPFLAPSLSLRPVCSRPCTRVFASECDAPMILTIVNLHLFIVLSKDHPHRSILSLGINPAVVFPLPLPHTASSWHGY